MRELSLFSGCGGGLLGSKLLGWTTLGYVEREQHRCRVLAQRIADGLLDDAPVYCGDVRDFVRDGYAAQYRGVVDIVSAGFPCQEFSLANYMHAGQGTAGTGDKNQWPATIETIRLAEPKYVLLENVVGLLGSHGYFGQVLRDLAEAGYDARWDCLSGFDVGASHVRRRIWIVGKQQWRRVRPAWDMLRCECCDDFWCPECDCHYYECDCVGPDQDDLYEYREVSGVLQARASGVADANRQRLEEHRRQGAIQSEQPALERGCVRGRWWQHHPGKLGQTDESKLCRVADGVARGLDRVAALGDGQIPAVVATAWTRMMENCDATAALAQSEGHQ